MRDASTCVMAGFSLLVESLRKMHVNDYGDTLLFLSARTRYPHTHP